MSSIRFATIATAFVCLIEICQVAFADSLAEQLDKNSKNSHQLDLQRQALETSIDRQKCPEGELKKAASPEPRSVCVANCEGLPDKDGIACSNSFFACLDSYRLILDAIKHYNNFLDATCTAAAKDKAAEAAAASAKSKAKEIEEKRVNDLR